MITAGSFRDQTSTPHCSVKKTYEKKETGLPSCNKLKPKCEWPLRVNCRNSQVSTRRVWLYFSFAFNILSWQLCQSNWGDVTNDSHCTHWEPPHPYHTFRTRHMYDSFWIVSVIFPWKVPLLHHTKNYVISGAQYHKFLPVDRTSTAHQLEMIWRVKCHFNKKKTGVKYYFSILWNKKS